jgi:CRISPR-associated protein Cas1
LDEFWFDDAKRLDVAKQFQFARIEFIRKVWAKDRDLQEGFYLDDLDIQQALTGLKRKFRIKAKLVIYCLLKLQPKATL